MSIVTYLTCGCTCKYWAGSTYNILWLILPLNRPSNHIQAQMSPYVHECMLHECTYVRCMHMCVWLICIWSYASIRIFQLHNWLTRAKLLLTCLYWYQPGIYVYMYVSHIYVYNISLHERASLAPGCIRFMFPYGSTATRVYQMYVCMCPYGKIRYVTYLYLLNAIMYVWDNRDAYSIYQWYVIWIGPLSTLFVFTPCLVKVDYVDNKQVIT